MKKIIKYKFYPSFRYRKLELWLKEMSEQGLCLIDYGFLKYVFKESEVSSRIYFVFNCGGVHKDEGKYSILLKYPLLEKEYGLSSHRSFLNKNMKNKIKHKNILEIDSDKLNDGFYELVAERDKLYLKRTIKNIIVFAIMIVGIICMILLP